MTWKRLASRQISNVSATLLSRPRRGTRILMFHAVGSDLPHDSYGISLSPTRFEDHVRALTQDPLLHIVSLSEPITDDVTKVVLTFDDGYLDNLQVAAPILVGAGLPFTVFVTTSFLETGHPLYLNKSDLEELASLPGVTIGSHGHSHVRLPTCGDDLLREELNRSRETLQSITGQPVAVLSYPHGAVDARVRDTAIQAGYEIGAGSRLDVNRPDRDQMLLCRTEIVAGDDARIFRQKTYGAWDWYRWRHRDVKPSAPDFSN